MTDTILPRSSREPQRIGQVQMVVGQQRRGDPGGGGWTQLTRLREATSATGASKRSRQDRERGLPIAGSAFLHPMTMNTFEPSYGDNLRLRGLRYRNLTSAATSVRVRSEQFEQERQLPVAYQARSKSLHIADGQLGILIAEVRRVDDEHRCAHRIELHRNVDMHRRDRRQQYRRAP